MRIMLLYLTKKNAHRWILFTFLTHTRSQRFLAFATMDVKITAAQGCWSNGPRVSCASTMYGKEHPHGAAWDVTSAQPCGPKFLGSFPVFGKSSAVLVEQFPPWLWTIRRAQAPGSPLFFRGCASQVLNTPLIFPPTLACKLAVLHSTI